MRYKSDFSDSHFSGNLQNLTMMKNLIERERISLNISSEQLALTIGINPKRMHDIEQSKHIPSTLIALKICRALKKEAFDIFVLEETD